jgi:hypothetical protein
VQLGQRDTLQLFPVGMFLHTLPAVNLLADIAFVAVRPTQPDFAHLTLREDGCVGTLFFATGGHKKRLLAAELGFLFHGLA